MTSLFKKENGPSYPSIQEIYGCQIEYKEKDHVIYAENITLVAFITEILWACLSSQTFPLFLS